MSRKKKESFAAGKKIMCTRVQFTSHQRESYEERKGKYRGGEKEKADTKVRNPLKKERNAQSLPRGGQPREIEFWQGNLSL